MIKLSIKFVLGFLILSSAICVHAENYDLRFGVLAHNKGPIASSTEDGFDINLAYHSFITAKTFGFDGLESSWHMGGVVNSEGHTSYIYAGVLGRRTLGQSKWFIEFGGGFAVHDGNLADLTDERRRMGSKLLFRYELGLGYRFNSRFSVQLVNDHISNGHVMADDYNQGLDTFGARLIYSFE